MNTGTSVPIFCAIDPCVVEQFTHYSDEALLRVAVDGNTQAWAALYGRFAPKTQGFAKRKIHPDLVQDVVQETLTKVFETANRFDAKRGSFWAFVIGLIGNALKYVKRRHFDKRLPASEMLLPSQRSSVRRSDVSLQWLDENTYRDYVPHELRSDRPGNLDDFERARGEFEAAALVDEVKKSEHPKKLIVHRILSDVHHHGITVAEAASDQGVNRTNAQRWVRQCVEKIQELEVAAA